MQICVNGCKSGRGFDVCKVGGASMGVKEGEVSTVLKMAGASQAKNEMIDFLGK